jgi:hypothetical protein
MTFLPAKVAKIKIKVSIHLIIFLFLPFPYFLREGVRGMGLSQFSPAR